MKTHTPQSLLAQSPSFWKLVRLAALFSLIVNLLLLAPSIYMLQVFDRVLSSRSNETLALLTLLTVGCLIVMMAIDLARTRLLMWLGIAMDELLGPKVLARLLADAHAPHGDISGRGLRDVSTLRAFLTGTGIIALFDAPWLPIYLTLIFLFHPLLGAIAAAGAGVLLILACVNERISRAPLAGLQAESSRAARFIDTSVRNAEVVGALGMIGNVTRKWQQHNAKVLERQIATSRASSLMNGAIKFLRQLIQIAVMAAGAYLVIDLHVTAGVMLASTVLLARALAPVETAIAGWKSFVEARMAIRRLEAQLSTAAEPSGLQLPAPTGALKVENVSLALRDRAILRNVGFELNAGEALGVIGASASGKSTLARILVNVWRPTKGTVRMDGADFSSWPREAAGKFVGYLPQDVELFSGTVAENIARLGPLDSDAVVRAAQRANVQDMILRLPQGYDTEIGEGGAVLSGGQRQRIALARALYGDPCLVVLDEPNANLDGEGEAALLQSIAELKRAGVTLVVIVHRLSLLESVDKVLVLREGAVETLAPRAELLAQLARNNKRVIAVTQPISAQRA